MNFLHEFEKVKSVKIREILNNKYIDNYSKEKSMFKNLSLAILPFIFVACSSNTSNVNPNETLKKENVIEANEVNKPSLKVVQQDEKQNLSDSNVNEIEVSESVKYFFDGEWISTSTNKFLQRKLILKHVNENYVNGYLQMSYENANNEINIIDNFELELIVKDNEIVGEIKDKKTNKKENVKILRDTKNELRVISQNNTIFFDKEAMIFKKASLVQAEKEEIPKIENVIYFVKDKSTVRDAVSNLIWQDDTFNKFVKSNFERANMFCSSFGSYRLPTRNELKATFDEKTMSINEAFKYKVDDCYWSGEYSLDDTQKAWCFSFKTGESQLVDKYSKLSIRCVKEIKDEKISK